MEHTNQPLQGLYDIYDVIYVPFWQTKLFFIILALVCIALISAVLWWILTRRKNRFVTPWERAQERLNRLVADNLETHAFYEQLTQVLKQYLSQRYQQQLSEKTDEEMVVSINDIDVPESMYSQLKELFSRAVAYKFGKAETSAKQMMIDVQTVSSLIQQTIPQEKGK